MRTGIRLLLLALALAAATLGAHGYRELALARHQGLTMLESMGVLERRAGARENLEREDDPAHVRILAGRSIIADALSPPPAPLSAEAASERRRDQAERLAAARELGLRNLDRRPWSWQSHLIVGSSTYLERALRRDDRLVTRYRDWEEPLEASSRLAPSQPEGARFLTAAYLEIWPMLSPEKRDLAQAMLTDALADPPTFERLIEPWLQVSANADSAFEPLPDRSFVWRRLQQLLAARGQWELFADARGRWYRATSREMADDLQSARLWLDGGDVKTARAQIVTLIGAGPPDGLFRASVEQALAVMPPGPVGSVTARRLGEWLDWNLDLCLMRGCAFEPISSLRLSGVADGVSTVDRARSHLAADDLAQAEQVERGHDLRQREWAPYLLQKVPHLLRRGEMSAARNALSLVHLDWSERGVYLRQRSAVLAQTDLSTTIDLGRRSWPAEHWLEAGPNRWRLELQPATATRLLTLLWRQVPPGGAAVDLIWDGTTIDTVALDRRTVESTLRVDASPDLHVLEIRTFGRVVPGEVSVTSERSPASARVE